MVAVKQDGYALQWVKEQTPGLCLAAVQQNSFALMFVKERTPEICKAAENQISNTVQYVSDKAVLKDISKSDKSAVMSIF